MTVRFQSLAEPGGICLSQTAHEAISNKLPLTYEFIGEQSAKNISKLLPALRVRMEPGYQPTDIPALISQLV